MIKVIRDMPICDFKKATIIELTSNPYPWEKESLVASFKSSSTISAYINNKLVGFLIYKSVIDECEIIHIVVDSRFRRMGIAQKLLNNLYCYLISVGVQFVFLEVREGNYTARRLYKNNSFLKVGIRKNYYNKEDGLVLKKTI